MASRVPTTTQLKKRLFFVRIDEPVIAPSAVAAHEADLDAIVAQGKRRQPPIAADVRPVRRAYAVRVAQDVLARGKDGSGRPL